MPHRLKKSEIRLQTKNEHHNSAKDFFSKIQMRAAQHTIEEEKHGIKSVSNLAKLDKTWQVLKEHDKKG